MRCLMCGTPVDTSDAPDADPNYRDLSHDDREALWDEYRHGTCACGGLTTDPDADDPRYYD